MAQEKASIWAVAVLCQILLMLDILTIVVFIVIIVLVVDVLSLTIKNK